MKTSAENVNMTVTLIVLTILNTICCNTPNLIKVYPYVTILLLGVTVLFRIKYITVSPFSFIGWFTLFNFIIFAYGLGIIRPTGMHFSYDNIACNMTNVIIVWINIQSISGEELFEVEVKCMRYSCMLLIAYTLVIEAGSIVSGKTRIGSVSTGNPNSLAMAVCYLSLSILYDVVYNKKRNYLLLLLICYTVVLLTGSKKGLFGIIISLFVINLLRDGINPFPVVTAGIGAFVLWEMVMRIPALYDIMGRRLDAMLNAFQGGRDMTSTKERMEMYKISWRFFKGNPILGNGWKYFAQYSGFNTYSHSNYTELLVSYGLLGFFVYYSYVLKQFISSFKNIRANCIFRMFVAIIVLMFFFNSASISFYDSMLQYILLMFSSLNTALIKRGRDF